MTTAAGDWQIRIRNSLPDSLLVTGGTSYVRLPDEHPTVATFIVALGPGTHALRLAPPDADQHAGRLPAAVPPGGRTG